MTDLFKHDPRIEEGTALRELEKKVHWLMYQLSKSGFTTDLSGNKIAIPGDCNVADIENDALIVAVTAQQQGVYSNSNTLSKNHQRMIGNSADNKTSESDDEAIEE